jgi:hypothetical protein
MTPRGIVEKAIELAKSERDAYIPVKSANELAQTLERSLRSAAQWVDGLETSERAALTSALAVARADRVIEQSVVIGANVVLTEQLGSTGLSTTRTAWLILGAEFHLSHELKSQFERTHVNEVVAVAIDPSANVANLLADLTSVTVIVADGRICYAIPDALVYDTFCYTYMQSIVGTLGAREAIAKVLSTRRLNHDQLVRDRERLELVLTKL